VIFYDARIDDQFVQKNKAKYEVVPVLKKLNTAP
jgi:hypothetical protein